MSGTPKVGPRDPGTPATARAAANACREDTPGRGIRPSVIPEISKSRIFENG